MSNDGHDDAPQPFCTAAVSLFAVHHLVAVKRLSSRVCNHTHGESKRAPILAQQCNSLLLDQHHKARDDALMHWHLYADLLRCDAASRHEAGSPWGCLELMVGPKT